MTVANDRINDNTVPYPSAAFDTVDHFVEWKDQGVKVVTDEDGIVQSWHKANQVDGVTVFKKKNKGWGFAVGRLPPVLQYRFPFNYVSDLLSLMLIDRLFYCFSRFSCP